MSSDRILPFHFGSVRSRQLFGSCRFVCEELLPRFGIASTLVDGTRLDAWRAAVRPETKAFFLESPTNPNLDLVDIAGVAEIAHAAKANLVVDNVFHRQSHGRRAAATA